MFGWAIGGGYACLDVWFVKGSDRCLCDGSIQYGLGSIMSHPKKSVLWRSAGIVLFISVLGCSDVGNQSYDQGPTTATAVAAAIGLGAGDDGVFTTRSGSEVILSGKDSDSTAAPLLDFEWVQISGPTVVLFERDLTSRSFTAPDTASTLEFELSVTDANDRTTSDRVLIDVEEIGDVNQFLRDPGVNEVFFLFVSPAAEGPVAATTSYTLTVTPVVYWTGRDQVERSRALDPIFVVSDQIDADFEAPSDPVDPSQESYAIPIPLLDADEVNQFFQGVDRGGRLEQERIIDATVELEITLTGVEGSANLQVFVAAARSQTEWPIPAALLFFEAMPAMLPLGAILDESQNTFALDLEKLRQQIVAESKGSAASYIACIDPDGDSATLNGWLAQAGFLDPANADSIVNAKYLNNYDLGFGRDMFLRQDEEGNVFSYVVNYPGLEALLKGQGDFATVVMEYSAAPVGDCASPTFSPAEKIVKFYAYAPNSLTGVLERTLSQNFDGRGERFLPGVCTACHDGSQANIAAFNPVDPTTGLARTRDEILASSTNLNATFIPWDLDSMLYARAASAPDLVDPSLNQSEFSDAQLDSASLEAQQSAFRALNEGVLRTYVGSTADLQRAEAPLRLIHGWYGESNLASPIEVNAVEDLSRLPAVDFDGSYVQPGWTSEIALYRDVYARYCRLCHTQQDRLSVNFDSYEKFINAPKLEDYIFDQGRMPDARLTMDRLWVDFDGDLSGAEILREHLADLGRDVAGRVPGQPLANISIVDGGGMIFSDPGTIPLPDITEVDVSGELLSTTISLLSDGSLFADEFEWMVTTTGNGCPTSPDLAGATSPQATLVIDSSPCTFSATLEARSDSSSDFETATVVADRLPVIVSPSTPYQAPLDSYLPGDDFLDIDVLSLIAADTDGDGGVIGVILDDLDITTNPLTSLIGDGTQASAQIEFDLGSRLGGVTGQFFEYKIVDGDGSLSAEFGVVQVDIPEIRPGNLRVSGSPTATQAQLEWDTSAGFTASRYIVQRADFPGLVDSDFDVEFIATDTTPPIISFSDNTLSTGQMYTYRVFTELDVGLVTERSRASDLLNLSTIVGVPSLLEMASGKTSSQIQLSMMAAAGSSPDSLELYQAGASLPLATFAPPLTTFTVTGLAQNMSYGYELAQTLNSIQSARSMPSLVATTRADPPTNVIAAPVVGSTTSLSLFWDPPLGGVTPTTYEVTPVSPTGSTISVSELEATVSDLPSDTMHQFRMASLGTVGLSDPTVDFSATTNVSFATNIAPRRTSGSGFNTSCSGCHSAEVWEGYVRNNTTGCLTNDLVLADCSPFMTGFTITSEMRDLLLRWNSQGELD